MNNIRLVFGAFFFCPQNESEPDTNSSSHPWHTIILQGVGSVNIPGLQDIWYITSYSKMRSQYLWVHRFKYSKHNKSTHKMEKKNSHLVSMSVNNGAPEVS